MPIVLRRLLISGLAIAGVLTPGLAASGLSRTPAPASGSADRYATVVVTVRGPKALDDARSGVTERYGAYRLCQVPTLTRGKASVSATCRVLVVPGRSICLVAEQSVLGNRVFGAPTRCVRPKPGRQVRLSTRYRPIPGLRVLANAADAWTSSTPPTKDNFVVGLSLSADGGRLVARLPRGPQEPSSGTFSLPTSVRLIDTATGASDTSLDAIGSSTTRWKPQISSSGRIYLLGGELYDSTTRELIPRPAGCGPVLFLGLQDQALCGSESEGATPSAYLSPGKAFAVWTPGTGTVTPFTPSPVSSEIDRFGHLVSFFGPDQVFFRGSQDPCGLVSVATGTVDVRWPDELGCFVSPDGRFTLMEPWHLRHGRILFQDNSTGHEQEFWPYDGASWFLDPGLSVTDGRALMVSDTDQSGKSHLDYTVFDFVHRRTQVIPIKPSPDPLGDNYGDDGVFSEDGSSAVIMAPLGGGGARNRGPWLVFYRLTDQWSPLKQTKPLYRRG